MTVIRRPALRPADPNSKRSQRKREKARRALEFPTKAEVAEEFRIAQRRRA